MSTLWITANLPSGTAVESGGGFPVAVASMDSPPTSTALSTADTMGAAFVAITGDTYSATTHQFTFGGATGLTHAQWAGASLGGNLNTVLSNLKTANSNLTLSGQVLIGYDSTLTNNQLRSALRAVLKSLGSVS
jgi:hypothetical protein